jgi:hypothetical protein
VPDWTLPLLVLTVFGPVVYWVVSHQNDAPRPARRLKSREGRR